MRALILHGDTRNPENGEGGGAESTLGDERRALRELGHEVSWWHGQEPIDQAVARFRPDVAQVSTIVKGLTPQNNAILDMEPTRWLLANGVPVVAVLHDYWAFCQSRMLMDGTRPCEAVEGVCARSCGLPPVDPAYAEVLAQCHVVTHNEYSAAILARNGIRVDSVVHLGVDTDLFRPDPVQRSATPRVFHSTAWWPYPTKGAHILQEAVRGKPWSVDVLTKAPRAVLAEALKRADIYVFPSCYEETYGLCLTEAMASGCACIASDVAGARAQIEHERTGLLVPKCDPPALAAAIERLLGDADLRERLGSNARRWAVEQASLPAMGARWLAVFEGYLNSGRIESPACLPAEVT